MTTPLMRRTGDDLSRAAGAFALFDWFLSTGLDITFEQFLESQLLEGETLCKLFARASLQVGDVDTYIKDVVVPLTYSLSSDEEENVLEMVDLCLT